MNSEDCAKIIVEAIDSILSATYSGFSQSRYAVAVERVGRNALERIVRAGDKQLLRVDVIDNVSILDPGYADDKWLDELARMANDAAVYRAEIDELTRIRTIKADDVLHSLAKKLGKKMKEVN